MSSATYLNTNSSSNTKTVASEGSRVLIENYNLPVSQSVTLNSDLKHETLIIPSTSMPAWNSFHSINLRDKNILLHNYALQFITSAVSGTSLSGYFVPSYFFFTKLEFINAAGVSNTIYNTEAFLRTNCIHPDEDRLSMNNSA